MAMAMEVHGQCVQVTGRKLDILSSIDDARDRITWDARDDAGRLLLPDPTAGTTTFELEDASGPVLNATLQEESAAGWRSSRVPPVRWTYSRRTDPASPDGVERVTSVPKKLFFKGKGPDLDEIRVPLIEPITMRVTTATGACFETKFAGCSRNDDGRVLCRKGCTASAPPPQGADRTIVLDTAGAQPWDDRLRAFNFSIQNISGASFFPRAIELLDRMFDPRPGRQVRLEYGPAHWPSWGFDASCSWVGAGSPPIEAGQCTTAGTGFLRLDQIAACLASTGADLEMRLQGQPAMFSPQCTGSCTGRMLPGGSCSCGGSFQRVPPTAYDATWRDHWKCVLKHYAALGVRRFEIWNEPDQPSFFVGNESDFVAMFEQMRLALEEARDELDPAVRDAIEIGGPAMSTVDGAIGSAPGPSLPVLYTAVAAGLGDHDLDFVSAHAYTGDPGLPFAAGWVDELRSFAPNAWTDVRLELNEWGLGLGGQKPCDDDDPLTPGLQAPASGQGLGDGCDHRGAGHMAYMLAGMLAAGTDVQPYVFEVFANSYAQRCDMVETGLGLFTSHGLPQPSAAVHWAASQMRGQLLGVQQETLTDRSLGWIAALDETGTVHVLLGQFDGTQTDHFSRRYASDGNDSQALGGDCGCSTASCTQARFADALANPDPVARLQVICPGLDVAEATDAIAAAQHALTRQEHTDTTVALDLRGLTCRSGFTVDVYTTGPGQSTAEVWRSKSGPHQTATTCDANLAAAMDAYPYDWEALQDDLWDVITTPTQTFSVAPGDPMPLIAVPAYGSVYVTIR